MGEFIGGAGSAFIMAAAAAVIAKFLYDINIIKDKDNAVRYGKLCLMTLICGTVYWFAAAFMYNVFSGDTNFFKIDTVFGFLDIPSTIKCVTKGDFGAMFSGMMMPLYPLLSHFIGKLVFEQYILTAQFISFASACVSACAIYGVVSKRVKKEAADNFMLIAVSVPFAFMLFTPTCYSLSVMFIALSGYMLSKGAKKTYIVMALLAVLSCKIGVLAFLIYPLGKYLSGFIVSAEKKLLLNGIFVRILITALLLINGALMCCLIRGIA